MVRDAATLWYLFVDVNQRYLADRRALTLQVERVHAHHREWVRQASDASGEPLRERVVRCGSEIVTWDQAIRTVQERYFEGVSPLMPDLEEHLTWLAGQAELVVERFNDAVEMEAAERRRTKKRTPTLPKPIDLEAVQRDAQPSVENLVRSSVDMARAEACEMLGEHRQAVGIADRHL